MTIAYTTVAKSARSASVRDLIDTGSGTATLKIYTAPRPATGGTPTGATLLATVNLPAPCGTVVDDYLNLDIPAESTIATTGVHAWGRIAARDGSVVCDLGTGASGSGADIEISAPTIYAGGILRGVQARLREP